MWTPEGPEGREAAKIAHMIVPWTTGRGLDVGCGPYRAAGHMIGIDADRRNQCSDGASIVGDGTKLGMFSDDSLDFVFSSHFLEHVVDTEAALKEWWRVIRPGGALVLYLPHRDFYPNMGQEGANPDHKHDFVPAEIIAAMRTVAPHWTLAEDEERNRHQEYSFYQVYVKAADGGQVLRPWRKQGKTCLLTRYGAIGDLIMASSVLPGLVEQGYRVTFNCSIDNAKVLQHDPNIADFWLQGTGQIPNQGLGLYWELLRTEGRWDQHINLSQSIEHGVLAAPEDLKFHYTDRARRMVFGGVNYVQRTHEIAGVPFDRPRVMFHATRDEAEAAVRARNKMGARRVPLVVWVPSGSAQHKNWPFIDMACTWLLKHTPAHVVMTGDAGVWDQAVVGGIEVALKANGCDMSRWHNVAGKWSVRESLTFLNTCADVVVGPETGMLNSVSMNPGVAKVVMLSHSAPYNLTRDWLNTQVALPDGDKAPCWPCHRMHYNQENCPTDPANSDAAVCASSIDAKRLFEMVKVAVRTAHARIDPAAFTPRVIRSTDEVGRLVASKLLD